MFRDIRVSKQKSTNLKLVLFNVENVYPNCHTHLGI